MPSQNFVTHVAGLGLIMWKIVLVFEELSLFSFGYISLFELNFIFWFVCLFIVAGVN